MTGKEDCGGAGLEGNFGEVERGFSAEMAVEEAGRCLACKKPGCVEGCPVSIDIPSFVQAVADGDFRKASHILKSENILPAVCGRVCPQEIQCEGVCVLGVKDRPLAIGKLERFVADWERENGVELPRVAPSTGKRVAVVGSGPSGLTAAAELARSGHAVTLYESLHEAGGVLMYGIPSFRLPREVVRAEIESVLSLGVDLYLNHLVGKSVPIDELLSYDAVYVATGAGLPFFMGIPGEHLNGVYSANEFLTRVNLMHADRFPEYDTPVRRGCHVAVVGGGNVALDAARVARRLGARATLVYRRREEDMPARLAEIHHAKEEGVEFLTCANPVRVLGKDRVGGVECVRMRLCGEEEDGRAWFEPLEGSAFVLDADVFIVAIGTSPNPLLPRCLDGLACGRLGNVEVDEEGRTSIPHVFAGGDVATGAATVILAMGAAKTAARAMNRMLSGGD
ncbi:MAG TPA: NADPH-dependent glutamate synthase [Methanomicrobiales archaeon]|nr:NADPH-dependent glutamate synthase [Methanomicrobiales archaeon]